MGSRAELREGLLLEVARLDESLEEDGTAPGARAELEARRAALVERLRSLG
jgi:hypothetical protein